MIKLEKENRFELDFKNRISEKDREYLHITFDIRAHLQIVEEKLKIFYGDRANWENNYNKYFLSAKELESHNVNTLNDMKLITFDEIKSMIDEEECYSKSTDTLIELLNDINGDDKEKQDIAATKAIEILGFERKGGIFDYFVDNNEFRQEDLKKIQDIKINKRNELIVLLSSLLKLFLDKRIDRLFDGTYISQRWQKYFYRGENAYYGSSKASCYRNQATNIEDYYFYQELNKIKLNESLRMLCELVTDSEWSSNINYYAVLQHYGIKTPFIDITSDIKTALFFACCKYENGKWRPLRKDEFENKDSRKEIANLGGDSRYGVIYRTPTEIAKIKWYLTEEDQTNLIIPVGYQPFMRCVKQNAHIMPTLPSYDMYKDTTYEKLRFRLSEEICNWIYKEFNNGLDIYPENDYSEIVELFNGINNSTSYSFSSLKCFKNIDEFSWVIKELGKHNITISNKDIKWLPKRTIEKLREKYYMIMFVEKLNLRINKDPIIYIT